MLSRDDSKVEGRFAGRLDALTGRVDTLASAVATTASAMAKKDGEIATLRRELLARDEQLQALAAQLRTDSSGASPRELHELREAVAALAKEHPKGDDAKRVDELTAKMALFAERIDTISTTVSTTAAGLAGREGELAVIRKRLEASSQVPAIGFDAALKSKVDDLASDVFGAKVRLDGQADALASLRSQIERQEPESNGPAEELRTMLATLLTRVESLDGLRAGVSEEALNERLAESEHAFELLSQRLDSLATSVESATSGLGEKERELADLHRHFLDSSARVETIVEDLREALGAFPHARLDEVETLATRLDSTSSELGAMVRRIEDLEAARHEERELERQIATLDRRVGAVAAEIARAKTLWPVALRSLEARLDDVARRPESAPSSPPPVPPAEIGDDPEDLLAGLRDSLHAMESVAAEMARAADTWTDDEPSDTRDALLDDAAMQAHDDGRDAAEAAAGGARVVPLRASEP